MHKKWTILKKTRILSLILVFDVNCVMFFPTSATTLMIHRLLHNENCWYYIPLRVVLTVKQLLLQIFEFLLVSYLSCYLYLHAVII